MRHATYNLTTGASHTSFSRRIANGYVLLGALTLLLLIFWAVFVAWFVSAAELVSEVLLVAIEGSSN